MNRRASPTGRPFKAGWADGGPGLQALERVASHHLLRWDSIPWGRTPQRGFPGRADVSTSCLPARPGESSRPAVQLSPHVFLQTSGEFPRPAIIIRRILSPLCGLCGVSRRCGEVAFRCMRQVISRYSGPSGVPFHWTVRSLSSVWRDACAASQQRVDASSLAVFRILFGLVGVFIVVRFFAYGWVDELYVAPAHHFTYLGFGWVRPWPGLGMYVHFAALGLLSIGIAAGYRYRLCTVMFFLGFTYIELLDKTTYLNHYYWAALVSLLMIFLPLHRSLSLDCWLKSGRLWDTIPARVLWLLRGQLAVVYIFAGIAKLNGDWLLEAQPLGIWLQDHTSLARAGPPDGRSLDGLRF